MLGKLWAFKAGHATISDNKEGIDGLFRCHKEVMMTSIKMHINAKKLSELEFRANTTVCMCAYIAPSLLKYPKQQHGVHTC